MHRSWKRTLLSSLLSFLLVAALASSGVQSGEARMLKRGMRGADVYALQESLFELGYDLAVDGVFGSETEGLIKEIQKAVGLIPDGVVGPLTSKKLDELRTSVTPYRVEWGDNLSTLAQRYDTTVSNITTYNGLENPDLLLPGQVLYIPSDAVTALSRSANTRLKMEWPVQGRVSSGYGYRIHPVWQRRHFHSGIDIAAAEGTQVRAAASGRVIKVGKLGNYGLAVVIQHTGGVTTWYGHNSQVLVSVGDSVKQGQVIAQVGRTGLATGPHLDFRIKIGDYAVNPLDWLP